MFNAASKFRLLPNIIVASVMMLPVISCSGNGDEAKAQELLDSATTAFEQGDYALSLQLTDSLKRTYPSQIDIRRKALHLSTRATEGMAVKRLETADSLLAVLGVKGDSLSRLIKLVKNPIENYYVGVSAVNPETFVGTTGIQARLTPNGDFYVISSLKAKPVKSTSVSVSNGSTGAATAVVAHDGERNDRSMGAEVITFMGVECDSLGHFIEINRSQPLTLTFNGTGTYSMPLSKAQAEEIATLYEYSVIARRAKVASLEKERLAKAVEIARTQAAKTYIEETAGNE